MKSKLGVVGFVEVLGLLLTVQDGSCDLSRDQVGVLSCDLLLVQLVRSCYLKEY